MSRNNGLADISALLGATGAGIDMPNAEQVADLQAALAGAFVDKTQRVMDEAVTERPPTVTEEANLLELFNALADEIDELETKTTQLIAAKKVKMDAQRKLQDKWSRWRAAEVMRAPDLQTALRVGPHNLERARKSEMSSGIPQHKGEMDERKSLELYYKKVSAEMKNARKK